MAIPSLQGKGNDILTNNFKGKFLHNLLPLFLPFLHTPIVICNPVQLRASCTADFSSKKKLPDTLKGFVTFCRIDCYNSYPWSLNNLFYKLFYFFYREMILRSFAILLPCGVDLFSGVEFVCCPTSVKQLIQTGYGQELLDNEQVRKITSATPYLINIHWIRNTSELY